MCMYLVAQRRAGGCGLYSYDDLLNLYNRCSGDSEDRESESSDWSAPGSDEGTDSDSSGSSGSRTTTTALGSFTSPSTRSTSPIEDCAPSLSLPLSFPSTSRAPSIRLTELLRQADKLHDFVWVHGCDSYDCLFLCQNELSDVFSLIENLSFGLLFSRPFADSEFESFSKDGNLFPNLLLRWRSLARSALSESDANLVPYYLPMLLYLEFSVWEAARGRKVIDERGCSAFARCDKHLLKNLRVFQPETEAEAEAETERETSLSDDPCNTSTSDSDNDIEQVKQSTHDPSLPEPDLEHEHEHEHEPQATHHANFDQHQHQHQQHQHQHQQHKSCPERRARTTRVPRSRARD